MDDIHHARADARITSVVHILNPYLGGADTAALTTAMAALAEAPGDTVRKAPVIAVFGEPGIFQGRAPTYAPCLAEMFGGGRSTRNPVRKLMRLAA